MNQHFLDFVFGFVTIIHCQDHSLVFSDESLFFGTSILVKVNDKKIFFEFLSNFAVVCKKVNICKISVIYGTLSNVLICVKNSILLQHKKPSEPS